MSIGASVVVRRILLQCQHPTWVPICVLAAPPLAQLPAKVLEKAAEVSPSASTPASTWGTRKKFLTPAALSKSIFQAKKNK